MSLVDRSYRLALWSIEIIRIITLIPFIEGFMGDVEITASKRHILMSKIVIYPL